MIKKQTQLNIARFASFAVFAMVFSFSLAISPASAKELSSQEVVNLVNKARQSAGIPILAENSLLEQAAQAKALDMLKNDYFAHTSPQGATPWSWLEKSGYTYKYAGENLAMNYKTAESQQKAWMNSATHKKNILNSLYTETGVAVAKGKLDGDEITLTVELFGTPLVAAVKKEAPVSVATKPAEIALPEEEVLAAEAPALSLPQIQAVKNVIVPELVPRSIDQVGITLLILGFILVLSPAALVAHGATLIASTLKGRRTRPSDKKIRGSSKGFDHEAYARFMKSLHEGSGCKLLPRP